jgi:hypothetical protein
MTEAFTKATFPSLVAGCWRIQRDTATNDEIIAYNNYLDKLDILEREVDDLWNKVENYMKRCTPTSRPD